MKQLINLYLDSADTNFNLNVNNMLFNKIKIISAYLITDSATTKIYFLNISDLFTNDITNSINSLRHSIPIYAGDNKNKIKLYLSQPSSLKSKYDLIIYDTNGTKTTDDVQINILIELSLK